MQKQLRSRDYSNKTTHLINDYSMVLRRIYFLDFDLENYKHRGARSLNNFNMFFNNASHRVSMRSNFKMMVGRISVGN